MTVLVTGSFRLPPDAMDRARPAMARVIEASRSEPGCLLYAYAEDVLDPGLVRVNEAWESRETLARHFAMPHMQRWREERESLGMTERQIVAHVVNAGEDL